MSDNRCEQFDDFYDGWLDGEALRRYQDHLRRCPRCQEKLRLQKWLDEQMVDAARNCVPPTAMVTESSSRSRFGGVAVAISAIALVCAVVIAVTMATVLRTSRQDLAVTEPSEAEVSTVAQSPAKTISVVTDSEDYIALVDESIEEVTFIQLYPVIQGTSDD